MITSSTHRNTRLHEFCSCTCRVSKGFLVNMNIRELKSAQHVQRRQLCCSTYASLPFMAFCKNVSHLPSICAAQEHPPPFWATRPQHSEPESQTGSVLRTSLVTLAMRQTPKHQSHPFRKKTGTCTCTLWFGWSYTESVSGRYSAAQDSDDSFDVEYWATSSVHFDFAAAIWWFPCFSDETEKGHIAILGVAAGLRPSVQTSKSHPRSDPSWSFYVWLSFSGTSVPTWAHFNTGGCPWLSPSGPEWGTRSLPSRGSDWAWPTLVTSAESPLRSLSFLWEWNCQLLWTTRSKTTWVLQTLQMHVQSYVSELRLTILDMFVAFKFFEIFHECWTLKGQPCEHTIGLGDLAWVAANTIHWNDPGFREWHEALPNLRMFGRKFKLFKFLD